VVREATRLVLDRHEPLRRAALLSWVGLLVAPGLLVEVADGVRRWGRSLGWGAATLAGSPVAILLLAVTVVGLPLALILLGLYLLTLYAAKIVVGLALGRALLRPRGNVRRDALRALVVGLALVTLATSLPLVGGPIWIVVAGLGTGALAGGSPEGPEACEARGRESRDPDGRRDPDPGAGVGVGGAPGAAGRSAAPGHLA